MTLYFTFLAFQRSTVANSYIFSKHTMVLAPVQAAVHGRARGHRLSRDTCIIQRQVSRVWVSLHLFLSSGKLLGLSELFALKAVNYFMLQMVGEKMKKIHACFDALFN